LIAHTKVRRTGPRGPSPPPRGVNSSPAKGGQFYTGADTHVGLEIVGASGVIPRGQRRSICDLLSSIKDLREDEADCRCMDEVAESPELMSHGDRCLKQVSVNVAIGGQRGGLRAAAAEQLMLQRRDCGRERIGR